LGGIDAVLPVDLQIPGCPPSPAQIIDALLALLEAHTIEDRKNRRGGERSAPTIPAHDLTNR
jgi:Ni,Fe-hydrogenase III small subunit